jgi:hypothetical protein
MSTMRKNLLMVIIVLAGTLNTVFAQKMDLQSARDIYLSQAAQGCPVDKSIQKLKKVKNLKPAFLAYFGVLQAMQAECTGNPAKKLEYFNMGKDNIEKAITMDGQNFDTRFARFTLQNNIPKFLGYDNMEKDARFLLNFYRQIDRPGGISPFFSEVAGILVNSGYYTGEEEVFLKKFFND